MIPAKTAQSVYHDAEKFSFELLSDNILRIFIKKNAEIELADLIELRDILVHLFGKKDFPVLVVYDKFATLSKEAREFIENPEMHLFSIIEAIVVSSLSQRLLISFMIHRIDAGHPQRVFTNETKALNWLRAEMVEPRSMHVI